MKKKDAYYFPHDYHARNDRKLINLRRKYGMVGIGVYWCLIEMLYEEDGSLQLSEISSIADELKTEEKIISSIISDFDLFKSSKKVFYSDSVKRRLGKRQEKADKAAESARIKWEKIRIARENANALRTHSDGNAIKEIKEKEIKGEDNIPRGGPSLKDEVAEPKMWTSEKNSFLNNEKWDYQFLSDKKMNPQEFKKLKEEFIKGIELQTDFKDIKGLKSHFFHWFNKREKEKIKPYHHHEAQTPSGPPLKKIS